MNFDVGDSKLINLWQTLHFGAESSDSTPSKQADSLRGLLAQINSVFSSGHITRDSYLRLFRQYADKYCKIIDDQDTDKGLNNFAEPVLSLVTGHRNDSSNWKSSLSLEALKKSAVWDNVIKQHEDLRPGISKTAPHVVKHKTTTEQHLECTTSTITKPDLQEWKEKQPDQPVFMATSKPVPKTTSNPESSNKRKFHTFYSDAKTKSTSAQSIDKPSTWSGNTVDQNMSASRQKNWDINPGPYSTAQPCHNAPRQSIENAVDQNNLSTRQKNWEINPRTNNNAPSLSNLSRQGVGGGKEQANQQKRINPGTHNNFSLQSNREQNCNKFPSDETSNEFQEQPKPSRFITAKQQYVVDCKTKNQRGAGGQASRGPGAQASRGPDRQASSSGYGAFARKTLGARRGPGSKFVPPIPRSSSDEDMEEGCRNRKRSKGRTNGDTESENGMELEQDERLKGIESKMVELIMNEIMDHGPPITWDDIAGLEFAKNVIKEIVIWPMLRPDIFKGLRGPPKGLLLFGPPGTGKTLIGKCIASQSKATFFSISASSLTSKWVGEGEKMVRALFAVARCHLPAVIFIDEIDSLLTQRTDGEHEASRRIKTEFLVQLDGATTNTDERLLVVGATNRPQEIDEAARRRLVKRLYIPLPDEKARQQIIHNLLVQQSFSLTEQEIAKIVTCSQGYSGSDMSNLCREAAIGPIRCIATDDIENISADQVRPIEYRDFDAALSQVRASVSQKDLELYTEWNTLYGSGNK